jgi:hypothetical protein
VADVDEQHQLRKAELMAAMSLATDLSMGQPMEDGLAVCLLATRLAAALGLSEDQQVRVYYAALLRHIGCTADMHVLAAAAGDDVSMRSAFIAVDLGRPRCWRRCCGTSGGPTRRWSARWRWRA